MGRRARKSRVDTLKFTLAGFFFLSSLRQDVSLSALGLRDEGGMSLKCVTTV